MKNISRELLKIAKDLTLGELSGAVQFSPKYIGGKNFWVTTDGIFVRGPHGAEYFRDVRWRDRFVELRLRDAPEEVEDAFVESRGNYRQLIRFLSKTGAFQTKRIARKPVAGDEWADEQTSAFAKEVARVMNSDRDIASARASGNRIDFVHSPSPLISVPLVLELMEFGYDTSESVNGRIFSEKVRNFRIPGGTTRKRDPKELWKSGKALLEDVMRRAM